MSGRLRLRAVPRACQMLAGGGLAALLVAQAPRSLGTIAGDSVQVSGPQSVLDAAGRLQLSDGAQVSLDGPAATISLLRGGAIRLCGPAQLGVAAGGGGALLLSLAAGGMELRYASPVADSVLTPDFRLTTVVPPDQLATVSASAALAANGDLCVMNRGSALSLERLAGGPQQFVTNGQAIVFAPGGGEHPAAACPCASAQPGAVAGTAGPGSLFPEAPALTVDANASNPAAAGAAPAATTAPAKRSGPHRFFLARFFHWVFG